MIRLLTYGSDEVYAIKEFNEKSAPNYAVLSHTWSDNTNDELTVHDIRSQTAHTKPWGYAKLEFVRKQAAIDDLEYFWIDTCCINKDSMTELCYSLNCMFRWYQRAQRCYVFLADVSHPADIPIGQRLEIPWETAFRNSRWFTRGWTLQELIAPRCVQFFSKEGQLLGTKMPDSLGGKIHSLTRIRPEVLQGGVRLRDCSVAERWLWSAGRETSVEEDEAYCLQGIFEVAIGGNPGEGRDNAQFRLWTAIVEDKKVAIVEVARALLVQANERRDATGNLAQKVSRRAEQIRRLRARLAPSMKERLAAKRGNTALLDKLKAQGAQATELATSFYPSMNTKFVEEPVTPFASWNDAKLGVEEQSREALSLESKIEEEVEQSRRAGYALKSLRAPLSHFVNEVNDRPGGATLSRIEKLAARTAVGAINMTVELLDRAIEALLKVRQELLKETQELLNEETRLQRSMETETRTHAFLPKAVMLSFFIVGSLVLIVIFGPWLLLALAVVIGSFVYGGASLLKYLFS